MGTSPQWALTQLYGCRQLHGARRGVCVCVCVCIMRHSLLLSQYVLVHQPCLAKCLWDQLLDLGDTHTHTHTHTHKGIRSGLLLH